MAIDRNATRHSMSRRHTLPEGGDHGIAGMALPGEGLDARKMPGHWLLARLGKRVLRPGGLELTGRMLEFLDVRPSDSVVEFAPGLGATAQLTLRRSPASYTAIERDEAAARRVGSYLTGSSQRCLVGSADATGLSAGSATVVYGEAMLTMQTPAGKRSIVREAGRLLKTGGRYAIHEISLLPEELDDGTKREVQQALSDSIHVGARPLTPGEWRALLEAEGFAVREEAFAPMSLLEPDRVIRDEGVLGSLRFAGNLLRDGEARDRVLEMWRVFRTYRAQMAAITLVATKADAASIEGKSLA